jgi:hypothetical protein
MDGTCGECGGTVTVTDGTIIRACGHDQAAVKVNLSATVYGLSHTEQGLTLKQRFIAYFAQLFTTAKQTKN